MTTRLFPRLLVAALFSALSLGAAAQMPPEHSADLPFAAHAGPDHPPPMLGDMVPPFLHGIQLTDEQQDKIFAILHGQAPLLYEQAKTKRKAREALHALMDSLQADDAKIRALTDTLARAESETMFLHIRGEQKIMALLTPEQKQQLETARARHREHGNMPLPHDMPMHAPQ